MGAVVEFVEDTFESVGDAVGAVAEVIGDAAEQVGNFVVEVGEAVVNTVEAIIEDPVKALPLIAVAVAAPYVAPYLWAGASTAQAAMVLNTGLSLANGVDPLTIAQNLAVSTVTQGITSNLDLSTGVNFVDRAIGNAASAAIQGGDIENAIGSSLGSSIIGAGTGALTRELRDFDYAGFFDDAVANSEMSSEDAVALTQGKIFEDGVNAGVSADEAAEIAKNFDPNQEEYAAYANAEASKEEILNSKIFKDAIEHGFTQEEAAAIAKGTIEGQNPTVSNPVAGSSVTVEGYASDAPETTSPITYASVSKEDLDQELADGEIDQETYDSLIKYASDISKSEQEYVDPNTDFNFDFDFDTNFEESPVDANFEESPIDATQTSPSVPYQALNETINEDGSKVYTYDDGSTLTLSGNGEVLDVTDATDTGLDGTGLDGTGLDGTGGDGEGISGDGISGDGTGDDGAGLDGTGGEEEYVEEEYVEEEDPKSKSGFSLKSGRPGGIRLSLAKAARSKIVPKTKTPVAKAPETGLTALDGGQYGVGLTSNVSKGNTEYDLLGEVEMGEPQNFSNGGSTATQGIYDLSTTASSPFLGGGNADIKALKPGVVKGKINYALPGYPFGQEWKAAKAGGSIQNAPKGHNPEFFSEGGLGQMKNTYVKGKGDGTSDSIAAMLANGEFVIPADVVSSLGNGSNDSGAKVLDEFLRTIRAHKRKADPKGLPPDSKGALGYLAAAKKKVKK
jgi:hypothetical protein